MHEQYEMHFPGNEQHAAETRCFSTEEAAKDHAKARFGTAATLATITKKTHTPQHAFRCKTCGHLIHAAEAGEWEHPHACPVCAKGVIFRHHALAEEIANIHKLPNEERAVRLLVIAKELMDMGTQPTKELIADNWEVLHECTDERLTELGLKREHVCKHTPPPRSKEWRPPQHIVAHAVEGSVASDKGKGDKNTI